MKNFQKGIFIPLFGGLFCISPLYAKVTNLNNDWRFSLANDSTCTAPEYNDNEWRKLSIPHDWSIELPFDKNAAPGNDGGYLPGGTGWYRKHINIPQLSSDKSYQLYVEGAYMSSDIYVNGKRAGGNPYGYSSYFTDITPFLKEGDNTIVIKVDNSKQKNCRWYSGSGLYRGVKLIEKEPVCISNWGTFVKTPDLNTLEIELSLDNNSSTSRTVDISSTIANHTETSKVTVPPNTKSYKVDQVIKVPEAKPWSPENPNLYELKISVKENGNELDEQIQKVGFRTLAWDAENGFLLNGENILLNGGCAHHDNGILGAAAYPEAEKRRVKLMKDAGFNAVRTSHNIPSEAFLDACDELGMLVIDESFDGWREQKNDYDYHLLFDNNWQKDLDAMILRDRNHPSIFCWSIGNEIIERDKIEAVSTARKLVGRAHQLDPTRPVTSALANWGQDWTIYDPLAEAHDIVGYNYMIHESEKDHDRDPSRIMIQTESYPVHAWQNYRKAADHPYILGDFVWTAIDYLGESGIGRHYYEGDIPGEHWVNPLYPWHGAHCGDIDLTGHRKPISHYRSMLWNKDGEHLYIAVKEPDGYIGNVKTTMWGTWPTYESWNWDGHEGKPIEVEVYSHYPKVRLYHNDTLVGEKDVEEMKATFNLPYNPGELRAEGIEDDGEIKEIKKLSTSGKPAGIRLIKDNASSDNDDALAFIMIEIVDADGNVVPVANNKINVAVTGPGELLAIGNADIKDEDPYFDNTHSAWKGRALAVVRKTGKKGNINIKVASPDLKTSSLKL